MSGNRDVYIIEADGSESTRVTWEPSEEGNPSWSRDGRWLYFRSDRSGIGQMWKIPVAGGKAIRVTAGEASQGFESPDGTLFYFVRSTDVPGLWSVPVSGGVEATSSFGELAGGRRRVSAGNSIGRNAIPQSGPADARPGCA